MHARWLVLAVLAAPLAIAPIGQSGSIAQAKNNLFIHLGLAFVVCVVDSWWLRATLVWTWAGFVLAGMHGWAFVGLLGVIGWCLIYQAASTLTETGWRNVQRAVVVAALFQLAWMGWQGLGYDRVFVAVAAPGTGHASPDPTLPVPMQGWFSNPMDAGLYLAMSVPALFAVHPALGILGALAALAMKSTAVLAALGAMALVLGVPWAWRGLQRLAVPRGMALAWMGVLGLLAAGGVAAYVGLYDPQGVGYRPLAWRAAWQTSGLRPWTGYGVNALDYRVIIDSDVGRWNYLFSEWLQWRLETGVIGVGLAMGYLGWLAVRLHRTWPKGRPLVAPALVVLVLSVVSIPFRIGPVALLAALYLGRLDAEVRA